MAASVDTIPPLPSPPASTCADTKLASDEDQSSEGSSVSMRREHSNSSSISEPAVEEDDYERRLDEQQRHYSLADDAQKDADLETAVPSGRASRSSTISNTTNPNVRRLSATEMQRLTNSPESLPVDRKSTRLNSSHSGESRMPSSA